LINFAVNAEDGESGNRAGFFGADALFFISVGQGSKKRLEVSEGCALAREYFKLQQGTIAGVLARDVIVAITGNRTRIKTVLY